MKADGSEHYYNERWEEYTGVRLTGDRDHRLSLVHPDDQAQAQAVWEQALLNNDSYDFEYRMRHHDGEYRWAHSRARKEHGPVGEGY